MLVVGFSGKKDSGKDTGANFLAAEYRLHKKPLREPKTMGMAWPLKKFCDKWLGVPLTLSMGTGEDKNQLVGHMLWENQPGNEADAEGFFPKEGPMTVREILQHWGTDVFRRVDPATHLKVWAFEAKRVAKGGCPLLFVPDIRFPNEVEMILDTFEHSRIVRLTRHPYEDAHESEWALHDFDWSSNSRLHVLDNTGSLAGYKRDLSRWFFHTFRDVL